MFSARIAIRLPSSFMLPPSGLCAMSGLARRLGEDRPDQGPQRATAALGTDRATLVVLTDRHRARDLFLAAFAVVLVHRHGHPPSGRTGLRNSATWESLRPASKRVDQPPRGAEQPAVA